MYGSRLEGVRVGGGGSGSYLPVNMFSYGMARRD